MSLFTEGSIWTMVHGIALGGGGLIALAAALFFLYTMRPAVSQGADMTGPSRAVSALAMLTAGTLWLTVLLGTYVIFPTYRATPPEGTTDLTAYPRFLVESDPSTAWLHGFAMEIKEHVPWIAAILATAVAFVASRHRARLWKDARLHAMTTTLVGICLVLVAFVAVLGVFVSKVAPVQ